MKEGFARDRSFDEAELRRIAEIIADLTARDAGNTQARIGQLSNTRSAIISQADPNIAKIAANLLSVRERIANVFQSAAFHDPAWTIMLDLYVQRARGVRVSITDACYASGAPQTTALRYIGTLTRRGLIERHDDQFDRRKAYIELTSQGVRNIEAVLNPT